MVAEDRDPQTYALHIRGNHKNLGEEVPRHFLQIVAGEQQPPIAAGSGRLYIADWMASNEESTHCARDGQPNLETSFWQWHGALYG